MWMRPSASAGADPGSPAGAGVCLSDSDSDVSATSGARDVVVDRPAEAEAIVQMQVEQQRLLNRLAALEGTPSGFPPPSTPGLPLPVQGQPSSVQELDALVVFASNATPTGPISQTAAFLQQQAQAQLTSTLSAMSSSFLLLRLRLCSQEGLAECIAVPDRFSRFSARARAQQCSTQTAGVFLAGSRPI